MTTQHLTFAILPVAVNQSYAVKAWDDKRYVKRRGVFYMRTDAKRTKEVLQWEARQQWRGEPIAGAVSVRVAYWWRNKRKDVDGALKMSLDCLQGVCYGNDSQIVLLTAEKHLTKGVERWEVWVEEVEPYPVES